MLQICTTGRSPDPTRPLSTKRQSQTRSTNIPASVRCSSTSKIRMRSRDSSQFSSGAANRRARQKKMQETKLAEPHLLDPGQTGLAAQEFEARLRSKVVGQDDAIRQVVRVYQTFSLGMSIPGRPMEGQLLAIRGPILSRELRPVVLSFADRMQSESPATCLVRRSV